MERYAIAHMVDIVPRSSLSLRLCRLSPHATPITRSSQAVFSSDTFTNGCLKGSVLGLCPWATVRGHWVSLTLGL